MSPDQICIAIASVQFGLINLTQALATGLTMAQVKGRLKSGRWARVLPTVYAIGGSPSSWHRDEMALCLWAGDKGAASHGAAARVLGLQGFRQSRVEISAVTARRAPRGYVVHRVDDWLLGQIDVVQSIPTTSVPRTVLDLAGIKNPRTERALDDALLKKLTTMAQMWLFEEQEWTRGRRGIAILRDMLVHRTPDKAPTQSDLELMFRGIVRRYSLPRPEQQYPIMLRTGELIHPDFAYPRAWLAIELDSYGWHMDREAFERDRARDIELQALGWRVLRFTWAMLKYQPEEVAGSVKLHLGLQLPSEYSGTI